MTNGLEKRKFHRLEFPIEVTAEIVTAAEVPRGLPLLHLASRNISRAGICLETTSLEIEGVHLLSGAPYARENRLHMTIELIPEEPQFTAIGEVRWYDVARGTTECLYQIGIEFLDIKGQGKDQLLRFLKSHKNNKGLFHKLFG
jgi:hypothetical protein